MYQYIKFFDFPFSIQRGGNFKFKKLRVLNRDNLKYKCWPPFNGKVKNDVFVIITSQLTKFDTNVIQVLLGKNTFEIKPFFYENALFQRRTCARRLLQLSMYLCRRVLFYALGRQSHLFRYSLTFNVTLNSEMFKAHPSRTK